MITISKVLTLIISLIMLGMFLFPLNLASFYFIFRPLVQPYAFLKYKLVGNIPLTAIFPIILIIVAFSNKFLRKKYKLLPPNAIPIYLLLLFSVLSFYNTMDLMNSVGTILRILAGISVYLLVYNGIENQKDLKKVLYAIVISSIIPMIFGYYQFATNTGHTWKQSMGYKLGGHRIDSLFGEYNSYGIFLCITIFASLMLIFHEKSKTKKGSIIFLLISMIISSILALNRGSWISLSFGLTISYMFYFKQVKIRGFIITSLVITCLFSGMIFQRFQDLNSAKDPMQKNTFTGRIDYWKKLYPLVFIHPVTGHGLGNSKLVAQKYINSENVPHNDYLRLALEVGIPSACLYLFFFFKEFFTNLSLTRKKENWYINFPMLAATIYFPIISITQNVIGNVIVFCMMFALIGISRKWNLLNN